MDIDAYLGVRCCDTLGEGPFHETHALLCFLTLCMGMFSQQYQ